MSDSTGDVEWIGSITEAMKLQGYRLIRSDRGTMDSGVGVFSNGAHQIEITRNRVHWMLKGVPENLQCDRLLRSFNDGTSLIEALHLWIQLRRCEELRIYFKRRSSEPNEEPDQKLWEYGIVMCDRWHALIARSDVTQADIDDYMKSLRAERWNGTAWLDLELRFSSWAHTKGFTTPYTHK